MRILKSLKTNDQGFTYLSLIIGVVILVMGLGFFMTIVRSSSISALKAEEQMAMARVAQNVAEVYLATGNETTAETQGSGQDYSVDLGTAAGPEGLTTVTITVNSRITASLTDPDDQSDPRYIEPYVLVFYTPE